MLIELKNVNKTYFTDTGVTFRALSQVSLSLDSKGLVFVLGKSGSGKSTLLNVLGALDSYDSGEVWVGDKLLKDLSASMLDYYRNTMVGFVFQEFNLINSLSVAENVRLALDIKGRANNGGAAADGRISAMLDKMGIGDKAKVKARNLSGGQRQRVAIARALIKEPEIILADEPTGSLDSVTGQEIIELLADIARTRLVVVVTHDLATAVKYGDRIIEMKDGMVYRDVRRRTPSDDISGGGAEIISNTLVKLEADTQADGSVISRINEIIAESGRKSYINLDTNANRTKALFPHLRESIGERNGGKAPNNIEADRVDLAAVFDTASDGDGNEDYSENGDEDYGGNTLNDGDFVSVNYTPSGKEKRKKQQFKKSKFALLSVLKMGWHNLKLKKFRLALIIVVTCLSFTLFGAVNLLSSIEMSRAQAKSIEHDGVKVFTVADNYLNTYDGSNHIPAGYIERLRADHKGCGFYNQYFAEYVPKGLSSTMAYIEGFAFAGFQSVVEVDDITELGLYTLYGTSAPDNANVAVISDYAAESLISGGVFGDVFKQDIERLVGRTITINGYDVIIGGIFLSDYRPVTRIGDFPLMTDIYSSAFSLFVGKDSGFIKNYHSAKNNVNNTHQAYFNSFVSGGKDFFSGRNSNIVGQKSPALYNSVNGQYIAFPDGRLQNKGDRQPFALILSNVSELDIANMMIFNGSDSSYINVGKNQDYSMRIDANNYYNHQEWSEFGLVGGVTFSLPSSEYYIDGYILSENGEGIALSADDYQQYLQNLAPVNQIMVRAGKFSDNLRLLRAISADNMQVNASFSHLLTIYMALFLGFEGLVTGAAVFLSLLAALLMYNFISTSIRLTKREIGLLRALGMTKFQTFLVYVMEGLVIAAITFLVSAAALTVITPIVNAALSAQIGLYLPVMLLNPGVFFGMAAISAAVSLTATFIPWFSFAKITPVEAISSRKN